VAIGGCEDPLGRIHVQASIELYDSKAGSWFLLDTHLAKPRTCAAVASLDQCRIVVAGGKKYDPLDRADNCAGLEVVSVDLPNSGICSRADDGDEAMTPGPCCAEVPDLLSGRMGCQAVVMRLPRKGSDYPMSSTRCLVAIGGERCDKVTDKELFCRAFNLETGEWCAQDVLPALQERPRTAVSLCVGLGQVEGF